jgi:hypothetical protein
MPKTRWKVVALRFFSFAENSVNTTPTKSQELKYLPTYFADLLGGSDFEKVANVGSIIPPVLYISIIDTDVRGGDRLGVGRSWLGVGRSWLGSRSVVLSLTARDIQIKNFPRWRGRLHMGARRPPHCADCFICTWRHQIENKGSGELGGCRL